MKKKRSLLLFFLCVLIFCCLAACGSKTGLSSQQTEFDAFLNELFVETVQTDSITLNYTLTDPEKYGISHMEPTLGDYTLEGQKKDLAATENYLARLREFDYKSLSSHQKLTYDILNDYLQLDEETEDFLLFGEPLESTIGLQAQLPVLFAEYNFHTKEDFTNYIDVISCTYECFKEILEFEQEKSRAGVFMSDAKADSIIKQCRDFIKAPEDNYLIDIFNEKVDGFSGFTDEEKNSLKEKNKEAVLNNIIPAYQLLADGLTKLKGTGVNAGGLCHFPKGKEYYEILVKADTGSSKTIKEINSTLDSAIRSGMLQMANAMAKDPSVLEKASEAAFPITDPEKCMEYLKTAISGEFPDLSAVNCTIKYVHKSLEDYLSPAFYLVPPIDNYTENSVYINKGKGYDQDDIFTVIAHEGYPGHLYQNVYYKQQNPVPIRQLLSFGGYSEGWATYVELYSYSIAGLDENLAVLLENNKLVTLCLYGKIDLGIHYYGWDEKETGEFLAQYGISDEKTTKEIFNTIVSQPGNYLKYILGALEFKSLRTKAEAALGKDFPPVEFHEFILKTGPCQFSILEEQMDLWLKKQK